MSAARYSVTTDPDKPCKRRATVQARSATEAARLGVLATHNRGGCPLEQGNIGKVERVRDRGNVTHVVTVVPTPTNGPATAIPQLAWLRVPDVWFWCECIVRQAAPRPATGTEGR